MTRDESIQLFVEKANEIVGRIPRPEDFFGSDSLGESVVDGSLRDYERAMTDIRAELSSLALNLLGKLDVEEKKDRRPPDRVSPERSGVPGCRGPVASSHTDSEFRSLLDLVMCSAPYPCEGRDIVLGMIERESRARGFDSWVEAYHEFVTKEAQGQEVSP